MIQPGIKPRSPGPLANTNRPIKTVNLIILDYRRNDSDFMNGFIQGIITATTNFNHDDHSLPIGLFAALRILSKNENFINTPSDKGNGVVFRDTTPYNYKQPC